METPARHPPTLRGLTQFAVPFRGEDQTTREEALPWIELARLVIAEVSRRATGE